MTRIGTRMLRLACIAMVVALSGCGFHLRRSAALPPVMQQRVHLVVNGGGEFPRALAAALRADKVEVLDTRTQGVPTLSVPVAAFSTRLLTTGGFQRVGEYMVGFTVQFRLADADGKVLIPLQTLELSHEFAVDQTQLTAITSETEAIQHSLVREMTDAVLRRLQARAHAQALVASPAAGAD